MNDKAMNSWNIFAKTGNIQDYLNYKQLENQLSAFEKEPDNLQNVTQTSIQELH